VLGFLDGWSRDGEVEDLREGELGTILIGEMGEAVAPLEDEAPATESRMEKAASQWVWAAMMSRSEFAKARVKRQCRRFRLSRLETDEERECTTGNERTTDGEKRAGRGQLFIRSQRCK
jgi:hypothetical protein